MNLEASGCLHSVIYWKFLYWWLGREKLHSASSHRGKGFCMFRYVHTA